MKQKLKKLLILAFVVLAIFASHFVFKAFTVEKQRIYVKYNSSVTTNEEIEAIVSVFDKNDNTKKGKLTLQLLDADNKKVKGAKEKYKLQEGEQNVYTLAVPEDLETGNYSLKLTAKCGFLKTEKTVGINISNKNNSDVLISLDKGIYKPGDTINYRALIISKDDNTPRAEKEVNVDIFDGNGNKVYSESTKTTEFGIVSGSFTLADEVNSGTYLISVDMNSKKVEQQFVVNPYILPQFEVSLSTDKDIYQVDETSNITINAKYFFGEPVANATVVGTVGDTEFKGLTDASGNFVYTYEMTEKGESDIEVSVTDTSNYLIEANKKIYAQEYAFEVETIFENGGINKNLNNNIYLVAKKIDGTPVKSKIELTLGKIHRQILTDENGIGKCTITAGDTKDLYSSNELAIFATDSEGNEFRTDNRVNLLENSVAISTDKIKYDQGEQIEVSLKSITNSLNRTVYVCKDGEILQMISTDSDEVTLDLEGASGLIDIFVEGKTGSTNKYYDDVVYSRSLGYYNNYLQDGFIRKTIFVKPAKSLDIAISTDKEEYKPGETLKLDFKVNNEKKESVDANILVSILDEAVLSLAENDLSMDNIRLALKDIQLTEDVSAADLYAEILDNKSESKLMLALLRHDVSNPSIQEESSFDHNSYEYRGKIINIVIAMALIAALYIGLSDSKKIKIVIKDVINVVVIIAIIMSVSEYSFYDLFDSHSEIKGLVFISIIVIMGYCLAIYKIRDKMFELVKNLAIIPGIFVAILEILLEVLYIDGEIIVFATLIIPILMTILIVVNRKYKLNKFWGKVKDITISLVKIAVTYIIAGIITDMISLEEIGFIIVLIITYLCIEKVYQTKALKLPPPEKPINIGQWISIGFFVVILVFVAMYIYNASQGSLLTNYSAKIDDDYYSGSSSGIDSFSFDSFDSASSSKDPTLDFNKATNFMKKGDSKQTNSVSKSKDRKKQVDVAEESVVETVENTTEVETTENVRNVFLESLAFIPDLVAKGGNASTEIKLSDNITTWNIQAVGNSKEGGLGSSTANFKVFKEFFVDFSLPTNSVVTDKTNIPVTIYNYKDTPLVVSLNVVKNDWSNIGEYNQLVTLDASSTKLVYIPLEILKAGNNTLRVEASANGLSDIVERKLSVTPNGYKKTNVISSSTIDESFETDYFTTEQAIENTRKLKVKIYPSAISQAIEGMENIFKMPNGCFEQTSSSLYPNILALKYLEDNNLDNTEIHDKALEYISSGYQRILTFEVDGEKGGYSLYGYDPAEPVITAFGLMELNDASEVYNVDDQVIENMKEYLFKVQKMNGSFSIGSTYIGSAGSETDLAMNAYIIWGLSEVAPKDERLKASIKYLEDNLDKVEDNYTLALMANAFTNTNSKKTKTTINKLMEKVKETSDSAYISSGIRDYYGSYGSYQDVQATALTSMALSKNNSHTTTNNSLVKYIISKKDSYGTWGTTQATILSLKAINMASSKGKIAGQTIQVSLNNNTKEINVNNNPLDIYELEFDDIKDENKVSFNMKKGSLTYELIEEYYVPYESIAEKADKYSIEINQAITPEVKVNDIITQTISITNNSKDLISNGLISINIPQGCTVNEMYLQKLVANNDIEKYEYNYNNLNLYIRNFGNKETKNIEVQYRASYPEEITGGAIRVYDYYNPTIEGVENPVKIVVSE